MCVAPTPVGAGNAPSMPASASPASAAAPADSSTSADTSAVDATAADEARLVRAIAPSVMLTVVSGSMMFSARAKAASRIFPRPVALAHFLGRLASASALLEFLLNPIFGKLSDKFGRKAIMPLGHLSMLVTRLLMFVRPASMGPLVLEQLITVPLVTSFFTTWRAAVSDVVSGAAYARAQAKIGVAAGFGVLIGPLMAKLIMRRAHVRWCFLTSSVLALGGLAHIHLAFEETLAPAKRRPLVLHDMQPLSFLQVMRSSRTLFTLMCTTGLQTVTEGRNVNNIFSVYMQNDLRWTWDNINNFVGALGVSLILSGLTVKRMLREMGLRSFTTFCNAANTLSWLVFSGVGPLAAVPAGWRLWLGLIPAAPGGRKRDAVEALIMKHGAAAGLGKGFISGSLMNFRAIVNTIAPAFLAQMYAWGVRTGKPGFVFFTGACSCLGAQGLWMSLTNQELGLDKRGFDKESKSK